TAAATTRERAPNAPAPAAPPAPAARAVPAAPHKTPAACRYCGGELPAGRDVHFCPHCGQNLTLKQCPACSTELELSWHFCVNCGRQVE
ncbi:MAG TPA: zinc ribbon domain-containing protein, partial [Gemmatimonadaceae bacterium]|nr:zinc ribbon domain-containing protein [Gemmatimonadaceae bacterium]